MSEKTKQGHAGKRLCTVREAGEMIALGPWAVRRLIARGELPFVRIGRRILIATEDVDALINARKCTNARVQ
jgi:excisionase family DNA binding protein